MKLLRKEMDGSGTDRERAGSQQYISIYIEYLVCIAPVMWFS